MKNFFLIACLLSGCSFPGWAQEESHKIDSLKKQIEIAKTDTDKIALTDRISFEYSRIDYDKGISYGMQAEEMALKANWKKGRGVVWIQ